MNDLIVVCGASGQIGSGMCAALLGQARLRALVGSEAGAARVRAIGVDDVRFVDLDKSEDIRDTFEGARRLCLIASGSAAPQREANALRAAHRAGAVKVVKLSSEAVSLAEADVGANSAVAARHMADEEVVRSLFAEHVILRATWFTSFHMLPALRAGLAKAAFVLPEASCALAPVHPSDVSEAIAACLLNAKVADQTLDLTGPEALGVSKIAGIYADVLERPVRAMTPPIDSYCDWLVAEAGFGRDVATRFASVIRAFAARSRPPVTDRLAHILGRAPRTFADYVRERRADIRALLPTD